MRSRLCTCIVLLCLSVYSHTHAQELHSIEQPLSNKIISVDKMEWQYSDTAMAAMAAFTIKNNAAISIRQIRLSLIAQDKRKVMLQHKGATTIRRLVRNVDIKPGEQNTLVFGHAFRAANIDQLIIRELIVEMSNGSLEVLRPENR